MESKASCEKERPWSYEEDKIPMKYVQVHGERNWRNLFERASKNSLTENTNLIIIPF